MNDAARSSRYGQLWTRDELILAFDLYCRIPFQQTKAANPRVQELAYILGRTPASVARKLGNFGAFDPELKKKGISGLIHGSKMDKEIWEEFHHDWNGLVLEAYRLRIKFKAQGSSLEVDVSPRGPTETVRETKVRLHQDFFREAVISGYCQTCCITGIRVLECLIASHIIPWAADESKRTDPTNGLCLSATFDRLFDRGLVTITREMRVQVSRRLLSRTEGAIQKHILDYHGQRILLPHRFLPAVEYLEWHRVNIFQG